MINKILLAFDGSDGAQKALSLALELAKVHLAGLTALAVADKPPHLAATMDEVNQDQEHREQHYGRALAAARELAAKQGVVMQTILKSGHPAKTILEEARENGYDLLILGHSGLSGVWALLGSTAEKVTRHAPCSVVVAR